MGQTLVVTSTWPLGITGTFLGDYFAILMDDRVEGFPFSVLHGSMYVGSTMCFVATALWCVLPVSLYSVDACSREAINKYMVSAIGSLLLEVGDLSLLGDNGYLVVESSQQRI